ncbi:DinB family protein [Spirillospora sp. NBC_01491]|uniref:DinB family protein n=1 Tax=Spirillospora sp. NBC_01491 TaxID=2976007 RepID=UPI002E37E63D|nr:DinB family protein [Spirillospora sp. NBC_01491]
MITPVEPPPEPATTLTDPRALLGGYLDFYRDALLRKLDGFPEDGLRAAVLPSGWTPLELLGHLTHVEIRWLRWGFAGEPVAEPWGDRGPGERSPEEPWHVPEETAFADLRAAFLAACERSREIVAAAGLDNLGAPGGRFDPAERPTLIWILFHLLQEYARHLGHLDVVRELADGRIGE